MYLLVALVFSFLSVEASTFCLQEGDSVNRVVQALAGHSSVSRECGVWLRETESKLESVYSKIHSHEILKQCHPVLQFLATLEAIATIESMGVYRVIVDDCSDKKGLLKQCFGYEWGAREANETEKAIYTLGHSMVASLPAQRKDGPQWQRQWKSHRSWKNLFGTLFGEEEEDEGVIVVPPAIAALQAQGYDVFGLDCPGAGWVPHVMMQCSISRSFSLQEEHSINGVVVYRRSENSCNSLGVAIYMWLNSSTGECRLPPQSFRDAILALIRSHAG